MSKTIGEQIREAREAKEWTQEDLALRAKVSGPLISKIENNKPVRTESLRKVMATLGVQMDAKLRGPVAEPGLAELEAAVKLLPSELRAPAARILRALPELERESLSILLSWIALYEGKRRPKDK